jgi:hypothetical protein
LHGGGGGAVLAPQLQGARYADAGALLGVEAVDDLHGQGRQRLSAHGQLIDSPSRGIAPGL